MFNVLSLNVQIIQAIKLTGFLLTHVIIQHVIMNHSSGSYVEWTTKDPQNNITKKPASVFPNDDLVVLVG